jgi:hypothetical protein
MRLSLDMIATGLGLVGLVISLIALRVATVTRRSSAPVRFRELEADARQLLHDFADNYDQLNTMLLRLAKRDERAKRAAAPETSSNADLQIPMTEAGLKEKKAQLRRQFGLVRGL